MGTTTTSVGFGQRARGALGAGVAGGLVGGVGMGVVLHAGSNMMPLVGALYGWPTVLAGWFAHMIHSVLIGLLFAAIVSRPVVSAQTRDVEGCVIAGIVYASGVGLVTGGLMLPVSLNAIAPSAFPEPLLPLPGVLGGALLVLSVGVAHLVYGLLLGVTFGYVHAATASGDGWRSVAGGS